MSAHHKKLLIVSLVCFVLAAILQTRIDPTVREINKGQRTPLTGLSTEFVLGPLLGLQQAVAGLLWIRADEFFHEGDYDAILPIVRMVTWLDPHNLDVYITGGWHLAYNFTDSSERSDRRYIPASQRLLEEGDLNNPEVYDIAFELAWQNSDKLKNYGRAEFWLRQAIQRKAADNTGAPTQPVPMFVYHTLAHSLARQGKVMESVAVWKQALEMTEAKLKDRPNDFTLRSTRDSEKHNLTLTLKRYFSRYKHAIDFKLDAVRTQSVNMETGEPYPPDSWRNPRTNEPNPPAIEPPFEVAFDVRPVFTEPKVLDLKGQANIGDGARIFIKLFDADYRPNMFTLAPADVADPVKFLSRLKDGKDPVAAYLRDQFRQEARTALDSFSPSNKPDPDLLIRVVQEVNRILLQPACIYDPERFRGVNVSDETLMWIQRKPFGDYLVRVNRDLLEEAFPAELVRTQREFSFDIDQTRTIMQDMHSVRNAEWGRKIDMSKDPKMYSFSRDEYFLVFEFDPRTTSPFIHDRFGWLGEGMTDAKYLAIEPNDPKPARLIRKVYRITADQVDGSRRITEDQVVPNAEFARIMRQTAE